MDYSGISFLDKFKSKFCKLLMFFKAYPKLSKFWSFYPNLLYDKSNTKYYRLLDTNYKISLIT